MTEIRLTFTREQAHSMHITRFVLACAVEQSDEATQLFKRFHLDSPRDIVVDVLGPPGDDGRSSVSYLTAADASAKEDAIRTRCAATIAALKAARLYGGESILPLEIDERLE